MTEKTRELSPADIALMPKKVDEWIAIGTNTDRANRSLTEDNITEAYRVAGFKPPREFIWEDSPSSGLKHVAKLQKNPNNPAKYIDEALYGSLDAYWIAFYDFFREAESVKLDVIPGVEPLLQIARNCGWWWPYDEVCVITEKPIGIHYDQAGRLHAEDGRAIDYADKWGVFNWHGYRIPNSHHWIIAESDKLNPKVIEAEQNAELRRVMLEKFGYDRWFEERGAKELSKDVDGAGNERRLLKTTLGGDEVTILHVINSSLEPDDTRREFFLGAMPGAKTPAEAVAMSFGVVPKKFKEAVCS